MILVSAHLDARHDCAMRRLELAPRLEVLS